MLRRYAPLLLRLLVSAAVLAALTLVVDLRSSLAQLRSISATSLVALLSVNAVVYGVFALRWWWWGRALALPLSPTSAWCGVYLLQVTSQLVPSPLLSDAARFMVFPRGTSRAAILQSIALDRLAGLLGSAAVVALLVPYYASLWSTQGYRIGLFLVPAGLLVMVVLLRRSRHRLAFLQHLTRPGGLAFAILSGSVLGLLLGMQFWLAASALPSRPEVGLRLVLLVPLLLLATSLLPISLSDWGTREAAALTFLQPTGLTPEELLAASVLVGLVNLCSSLPGLLLILRRRQRVQPAAD